MAGTRTLVLLSLAAPLTSLAEVEGPQVTFSPHAGSAWWYSGINLKEDVVYGARLGVLPSAWFGFEGTVDYAPTYLASDPSINARTRELRSCAGAYILPLMVRPNNASKASTNRPQISSQWANGERAPCGTRPRPKPCGW